MIASHEVAKCDGTKTQDLLPILMYTRLADVAE